MSRHIPARWGIPLLPLLMATALPVSAQEAAAPPATQAPRTEDGQTEGLAYAVTLQGASGDLGSAIEEASRLFAYQNRPPGSAAALRRRIERDRQIIDDVLRSRGYYGGTVDITAETTAEPAQVTVSVTPGPLFTLSAFTVESVRPDRSKPTIDIPLRELGLKLGEPARAKEILAAQERMIVAFARRGYPLAERVADDIVVDHATTTVRVALTVNTGPLARFGPVEVKGLTDVERQFVINRLPWRQGEPFDFTRLEQARERLVGTDLFASIRLTPGEAVNEQGELPIVVELAERQHRTIGGAISWSTNEGFGVEAFWEHRNILSAGEKLKTRGYYNGLGHGLEASFRNPDVFGADWDLISTLTLAQETTEAYDATSGEAMIGADLKLTRHWKVTTGLAFEYLREDEGGEIAHFSLVSLPASATRDSRDNLLDPTEGGRFSVAFEPHYDVTGDAGPFLRLELSDTIYYQVFDAPRVILAGWGDVGSVIGANLDQLPAGKRLYAGGGGSVRGFGYQMAGPVDASGDPIGGRSLVAFGAEARINVTEEIGIVPFIEAGTVFEPMYPDFSEPLFWGAGIGVRYNTPIGPLRADIAFPLNGRDDVDDAFQIYLSFGQAF